MSHETPAAAPSESPISNKMLGELSHLERADLLKRLQELTGAEFAISQHLRTARRWFTVFLAVCCVALIPWTIGLGLSLPRTYVAANWQVLWTGFDVGLLVCLFGHRMESVETAPNPLAGGDHHQRPPPMRRLASTCSPHMVIANCKPKFKRRHRSVR